MLVIGFIDINKNGLNLQNTPCLFWRHDCHWPWNVDADGFRYTASCRGACPLVGGIVDIINNGVSLENSLLVIAGIMTITLVLAIKAVTAGMTTLGITIGLVGLAIAALVGAFLYISSVWDQMSGFGAVCDDIYRSCSRNSCLCACCRRIPCIVVMGIAVAGIVGAIAAVAVAFASVQG